jgi:glycosyltransferase involved in cell wall biosynthesis
MKALFLEPFACLSHMAFVDALQALFIDWDWTVHTLPDRQWKWRSRLSGLQFSQMIDSSAKYDILIVGSLVPITELLALSPKLKKTHCVCYFHENQFHYPFRTEITDSEKQIMYTSITTALAADSILFNSDFNRKTFLAGALTFLNQLPVTLDKPRIIDNITNKAQVFPIPLMIEPNLQEARNNPPAILWNHRWEHDKCPEVFFEALFSLADAGLDFKLIVLGEQFDRAPAIFTEAREKLADRTIHFGFVRSRTEYEALLARSDIVVSTTAQEFYGLSILEAVACGAIPVVPDALSYPELLPAEYRYPTASPLSFSKALSARIQQGIDNNLPTREEVAHLVTNKLIDTAPKQWRTAFITSAAYKS